MVKGFVIRMGFFIFFEVIVRIRKLRFKRVRVGFRLEVKFF